MPSILEDPKVLAEQKIFSVLFKVDEITWQALLYDLVQNEQMDPWDIDVSQLAHKFLEKLSTLKEMDFRLSGKIVLAAAILLKIKSNRLLKEDIAALDAIINATEEELDLLNQLDQVSLDPSLAGKPKLYPRTPQPRRRKVSIFDLVEALEQALEVEARRPPRVVETVTIQPPTKKFELHSVIAQLYERIQGHFQGSDRHLLFSELVPSDTKEDKVYTFIPLLHLDNSRKVDLLQDAHLAEISIALATPDLSVMAPGANGKEV